MFQALVLPLAIAFASPQPQAAADPYAIYRAAMAHLATLPQPPYIIDTEHWVAVATVGQQQSQPDEWDERVLLDAQTRMECVINVPFTPTPFPEIGVSQFAPDSWLIDHRGPRPQYSGARSSTLQPDLSDLRTVASAVAIAKPSYDIRLAGIDRLTHGGSAYHLLLRPRLHPRFHNLRQLWINTETGAIVRAVIEGDYRPDYYSSLPDDTYVTEDFGQIGRYWLVIHWAWTYRAPFSNKSVQYDATATSMRFPETLPDWFFDRASFRKHVNEVAAYVKS